MVHVHREDRMLPSLQLVPKNANHTKLHLRGPCKSASSRCFVLTPSMIDGMTSLADTETQGVIGCFGVSGEAVETADDHIPEPALESDPMFDPMFNAPKLLKSGTGAKVLFTTADLDDNHTEAKRQAAALHFWNWNRKGEVPGAGSDDI